MITVLKLGGSLLEPAPSPALFTAVQAMTSSGEVVLVHGGGKTLTALAARLNIPTEFRNGLRVTGPETLAAAVMALAGTVNTALVAALNASGVRAVGLTGCDAACVEALPQPSLGAVGSATAVDAALLRALLASGFVPVLASLAKAQGGAALLNVNADQFAAAVAAALHADRLLFLTDVEGVLDASGRPLAVASLADLRDMAANGAIRGGMLPKAAACAAALERGVAHVAVVGPGALAALDASPLGTQVTL